MRLTRGAGLAVVLAVWVAAQGAWAGEAFGPELRVTVEHGLVTARLREAPLNAVLGALAERVRRWELGVRLRPGAAGSIPESGKLSGMNFA